MVYGTLKRKKSFNKSYSFVLFWTTLAILILNLVFFSSTAGYYWVETMDHYAAGFNLMLFMFMQIIVWVYMLPISKLVEKVKAHGEIMPEFYVL